MAAFWSERNKEVTTSQRIKENRLKKGCCLNWSFSRTGVITKLHFTKDRKNTEPTIVSATADERIRPSPGVFLRRSLLREQYVLPVTGNLVSLHFEHSIKDDLKLLAEENFKSKKDIG